MIMVSSGRGDGFVLDRQEVLRLCRVSWDRSAGHRALAVAVSVWTGTWLAGQAVRATEPLHLLGLAAKVVGLDSRLWTERLVAAWTLPTAAGVGLAVLGGLFWSATTERGQAPSLVGWVVVMLAAQTVGHQPAVLAALATLTTYVAVLWMLSWTGRRFVDRSNTLLPRDVLRAGVTAATLTAVVPLLAPGAFVARVLRPYVTRAPRPSRLRHAVPAQSRTPAVEHEH